MSQKITNMETNYNIFVKHCEVSKLDDVLAFYMKTPNIDIHAFSNKAFRHALYAKNLMIAGWLWNVGALLNSPFNIAMYNHTLFDSLYGNDDLDGIIWLLQKYYVSDKELPFNKIWSNMKKNIKSGTAHKVTRYLIKIYIHVITKNTFNIYFIINTYCKNKAVAEIEWLNEFITSSNVVVLQKDFLKIECLLATHCNHELCYNCMYNWMFIYRRC